MVYVLFVVVLLVTNLLTFRFTAKYVAKAISKELDAVAKEWKPNRKSGNYTKSYAPRSSTDKDLEEYIIENLDDAEHVLATLKECANKYGFVSVADYHDLIKVASSFSNNAYGWTRDSMNTAMIVPVRGGQYVIKFPPVNAL